ncbi:hypothetical protein, partial [Tenacibaculum maritimum]|uniref:hypothetical protein n=1 Tax=Tenacibaculum maritimum TaxID=107401 RepID=UPI003876690D
NTLKKTLPNDFFKKQIDPSQTYIRKRAGYTVQKNNSKSCIPFFRVEKQGTANKNSKNNS